MCNLQHLVRPENGENQVVQILRNDLEEKSAATGSAELSAIAAQRLDLLVNNFVYKAYNDKYLVVFEGHFKRNYIHLLDVCQAFELALSKPEHFQGKIFNVGLSTANVSKLELCALIKQRNPEFTYLEAPLGKDPDQQIGRAHV